MEDKVEVIIDHDYVLMKGLDYSKSNNEERRCSIQIPIEEARILFNELLKEDFLQEKHSSKYGTGKYTEYVIRSNGWQKSKKI